MKNTRCPDCKRLHEHRPVTAEGLRAELAKAQANVRALFVEEGERNSWLVGYLAAIIGTAADRLDGVCDSCWIQRANVRERAAGAA